MKWVTNQDITLVDSRRRGASTILRAAMACALVATLATGADAQVALMTSPAQERSTGVAITAPLPEQLDEARDQVRQAQELRDKTTRRDLGQDRQGLASDKQRLLDWLVDLQHEKVKRIEEVLVLRNTAAPSVGDDPLIKPLQGTAPYSAIAVDALRDEIDSLKEKLAAAEAGMRANQTELQNLHDQLKTRDAASRQAGERVLGARTEADAAKAKGELEVIALLKRIAEVEIAVAALDKERLSLQISAWRKRIEDMQAVVAQGLPGQRLSADDLAAQRQRVQADNARLAAEIEGAARQYERHRAERDRPDALLDLTLKTDNAVLKGLDHLQMLASLAGDAWDKRYAVMSDADAEQRHTALAALNDLRQKLADWRGQSRVRHEALQTEIRTQRIRVDNAQGNSREHGRETEILSLLLRQTAMNERVELAAARLEKQVSRWLDDFAAPENRGLLERAAWLRDRAIAVMTKIWQQELFVAEDVSEIDGRKVSVKYGITVGKSIGLVVVFVLGYWLLARLSRFIQHQLVRRFKVSNQLASVIRRWSMVALSFALIVLLLNLARIPLSVFAFLGGALAIGFGFGAQTIIKNFISGLILLFERKVRVGDVVELGGMTGHVTAVDLRATTVHGFNGVEAHIPNANFIENQVINWTYSNLKLRRELHVDVAYGTDMRQAEALFLAAAAAHPCVLRDPAPEVFFDGFGDSALKVALVYWVEFENPLSPRRVDSDLRHDIYGRLAASGIHIPFPQRVLHVNFAQPVPAHPADPEPIRGH